MKSWTPEQWVILLTCLFSGIGSIITVLKANQSKHAANEAKDEAIKTQLISQDTADKAVDNQEKLVKIHKLTDGNLSKTQNELETTKKRANFLEKVLMELNIDPIMLDSAKRNVETKEAIIGKRRKTDSDNLSRIDDEIEK